MMRNKSILFLTLTAVMLSACKGSADQNFSGTVIDVPMLKEQKTDKPLRADIIESIDTIRLEGSVLESFIGHVEDIKFSRDRIFVMSTDVINIFDNDGKFLTTIQRKGRGPGEYISLRYFDILEDQQLIYAVDNQGQQVVIYDFDGKFVRHIPMQCYDAADFAVLPNGHMLFMNLMGISQSERGLYETDENGQNMHPLFEVAPDYQRLILGFKFLVHIDDNTIGCMGLEDTDYIYHYKNDSINPVYKIKTDIVMPDQVRQGVKPDESPNEVYTKMQYWETQGYMGITLTNEAQFAFTMYNKKTAQTTRYYKSELMEPDPSLDFVPSFSFCYKNRIINVFEAETILQYEPLKKDFPGITIDSNPVLIIIKLKE